MSKKTGQTFVFGAVVLMASNILVKLIGALFRIPLTNIIKVEGMGYFNAAYSIPSTLIILVRVANGSRKRLKGQL